MYTYIFIYIYMYICVSIHVYKKKQHGNIMKDKKWDRKGRRKCKKRAR